MPDINDQNYLRTQQYKDAKNLTARQALHARFGVRTDWFDWVYDHLKLSPSQSVLELGCGPADLWLKNRAHLPAGCEIILTDFSLGMLEQAQANLHPILQLVPNVQIKFRVVDAQEIPFPAAAFDLVIANHMLYHVPDLARALAEIRRVLRPGGRLIAATNGENHMHEITDLVARFDPTLEALREHMGYPFSSNNGAELLAQQFTNIRWHFYPDELLVTEVEPLVDYVFSAVAQDVPSGRKSDFREFITRELARLGGVITIHKEVGLFEAS